MLQKMHDHMKGIVTVVLFGVLAVVFVFWGINNKDVASAQGYAIKVNDKKFTAEEVRRAVQAQIARFQSQIPGEMPLALRDQIRDNVVAAYIENELLLQRAHELHYRVGADDIDRLLKSRREFQVDGKFELGRAQALLAANRMSLADWEKSARETLQVTQLQNGVIETQFVLPGELARSAALELEQREVSYAVVAAARFVAAVVPTDAEIKSYYDAHQNEFLTDETVTLEYVELKRDELPAITVTEEDLKQYYAENEAQYKLKERRRAQHILVSVTRPEDNAAALKKANDLYAKLQGGADFAALAKQDSDDATTQTTGGDLGWREQGGLEPEVDRAVFAMQANELHAPIKSRFGYHIVRLEGIEAARQKPFAEVRAELEPEYRAKAADRAFGDRQSQLEDLAFSHSGGDFKSLATTLKLDIKTIADFSRTKGGGAIGDNKAIIDAAFSDDVLNGGNSEPKEIAPGDVIVMHASARKPAEPKALAEVKSAITVKLKNAGARAQAKAAGEALIAKLDGGAIWDQALAAEKLSATPRQYVPRTDKALPPALKDALYDSARPKAGQVVYGGTEVNDGDYAIFAFSQVRDGSSGQGPEQLSGRAREIAARLGNGDMAAYAADVERKADIERNLKALE